MSPALIFVMLSVPLAMAMKSRLFYLKTSSNGTEMCAVDNVTRTLWMPPLDRDTECGLQCLADQNCLAFNINNITGQCDLFPCHYPTIFTTAVQGCRTYLAKGYTQYARDCNDVMLHGDRTSGVSMVCSIVGTILQPLLVYCDMDTASGGWMLIQRRMDGSVDFYRNWANYSTGFGQPDGEFWLGNDNIHRLTSSKRYRLRFDMTDFGGNSRYAEYDNFIVDDVTNKYKLSSLGEYSGTAGDAMLAYYVSNAVAIGMFFTTYDSDNDLRSYDNCAVVWSGAWWYRNCHAAHPTGLYMMGSVTSSYAGHVVSWQPWRGLAYSMKTMEMKIKPF